MLNPSFLFTDGAVLQRERPVPVFGECDARSVSVSYLDRTASATVRDGRFEAILPPMPAGLSGELIITTDAGEQITFSDVLTGDVYLAGGQSNMEHPLFCTYHGADSLERDDGIRLFTVPRRPYEGADVIGWHFYMLRSEDTPWRVYDKDSVWGFSAVAAFFAKRLRASVDVPIGIINCNWGATNAETWVSREALLEKPLARFAVDKYDEAYSDIDKEKYHADFEKFCSEMRHYINTHPTPMDDSERYGIDYSLRHHFPKTIPEGPYHYKTPGAYRKTMLERVIPYALAGVLWYQGESNVRADLPYDTREWFREVMHTLIDEWREDFRDSELPFYIVQISSYETDYRPEGEKWCPIRDVHEKLAEEYTNVYTVPSVDIGEPGNIHPANKKPIGERLALAALANRYGMDVPWRCPKISSVRHSGNEYILSFTDGEGLFSRGGAPEGFYATAGEAVYPISARIENDLVIIRSDIPLDKISYAYRNFSRANVYNGHSLPLFPFKYELK